MMQKGIWYAFREVKPGCYEVSGFDPLEVGVQKSYEILNNSCSCPAHVPFCKHLRMLSSLKDSGSEVGKFINDETSEIISPIGNEPFDIVGLGA